jgi:hypothetical protein
MNCSTICYNGGECHLNTCVCTYFYEPITNCTSTYFELTDPVFVYIYTTLRLLWSICIISLYLVESILDLTHSITSRKRPKTSFYIKCVFVIVGILTLAESTLFCVGYQWNSVAYAYYSYYVNSSLILLILVSVELAAVKFMEMLIKAKNLNYSSKPMKILRRFLLCCVFIGAPIPFIALLLDHIGIASQIMVPIYTYIPLFAFCVSLIVVSVYIIRYLYWVRTLSESVPQESNVSSLYPRTICLLLANITIIVNFIQTIAAKPIIFKTQADFHIFALYVSFAFEIIIIMLLWGFSQNYSTKLGSRNIFMNWYVSCRSEAARISSSPSTSSTQQ